MSHRGKAVVVGVWLLAISTIASAEPSTQDRALAEELFRTAKQLAGDGKYVEACPKFAESQQLDPQLGTLLHLATCHEQEGKTATAWIEFTEAASLAAKKKEQRREAIARERADALDKRLSRLKIAVVEPLDDMEVRLDGKTIGAASLKIAIPVDPGEHRIDAGAPDRKAWSRWIEVAPGPALETVSIPALEAGSGAMPPRDPPGDSQDMPSSAKPGDGSPQLAIGFTVGAVGLAAVVVGAVFGGVAASQASDADEHCDGRLCSQTGLDGHEDASDSATASTVLFTIGLVAASAGVIIVLTAPDESDVETAIELRPGGVRLRGSW